MTLLTQLKAFFYGELSRTEAKHEPTPPIDYPNGFSEWANYLRTIKR